MEDESLNTKLADLVQRIGFANKPKMDKYKRVGF